jgi:hypothetical protein
LRWQAQAAQHDDITLIVVKVKGGEVEKRESLNRRYGAEESKDHNATTGSFHNVRH